MSLATGVRVGTYEVLALIGSGGMGEVYRARDTKLHREVALKVLPDLFANDPERLARFQREAQVLASLNHPNIAAIHGLEDSNGVRALVLELVEGPTLADRIAQGPILLDEALPIARQIAEALEAAHEHGIIHRDLKPANIKVRSDGTVKVLDFGLAKLAGPAEAGHYDGSHPLSQSPTITSPAMTRTGVIFGTAAYMAPEQARGKAVDKRADIWAFGCVLFEMLTGRQAFQGEDASLVLSKVLQLEPDWTAVPVGLPDFVVALMKRCLRKDPKARLRDIGDARIALAEGGEGESEIFLTSADGQRRGSAIPWIVSGVLGLAVLVLLWRLIGGAGLSTSGLPARFEVELPMALPIGTAVAFSPDGHHFVFVGGNNTGRQVLFRRTLDELAIQEIGGSTGANYPFFSPDRRSIGFHAEGELRRVPVEGGLATTICETPEAWGTSWSARGDIVFGTPGGGLFKVPAAGGTPTPLTRPADDAEAHVWPRILPDGETVLFTIWRTDGRDPSIGVVSLEDGDVRAIVDGTSPQYSPSGHLLFVRQQTLLGVPFDVSGGVLLGEPRMLVDGISTGPSGFALYELSTTGDLIYLPIENPLNRSRLLFVDRNGKAEAVLDGQEAGYLQPAFSPDGHRLAFGHFMGRGPIQLSTYDPIERRRMPLVFDAFSSVWPVWSPDGQWVAFTSDRGRGWNVFRVDAGGSGKVEQLTVDPELRQAPTSWSVDNVLAIEQGPIGVRDILTLSLADGPKLQPLLVNEFNERGGKFSPNGRWLAFTSNRSGQDEIWVKAFPGDAPPVPVSIGGGNEPVWSRDGRELFYRNRRRLMRVPIQTEPSFRAGQPSLLFEGDYTYGYLDWSFNYDVAPDGSRFVMVEEGPATKATFLLNWFAELERLIPRS